MSKRNTGSLGVMAWLVAALLGIACSAQAQPYSITVENEQGGQLPVFHQGGQVFVLGHYGQRYNIHVRNHTGRRVEAVVTVDGRDVVSGDPGDYTRQRGYVLQPYSDVVIEGFRQSLSHVAAFRFTSPGDSYSARRGTPQNVGIVGVAFFAERYVPPPPPQPVPYEQYDSYQGYRYPRSAPRGRQGVGSGSSAPAAAPRASAAEAPAAGASRSYSADEAESDSNIGTQYGESHYNQAREVRFVRANHTRPDLVTTLRYDDANGLMARGIEVYPPQPRPYVQVYPEAFPANRFAPPPP